MSVTSLAWTRPELSLTLVSEQTPAGGHRHIPQLWKTFGKYSPILVSRHNAKKDKKFWSKSGAKRSKNDNQALYFLGTFLKYK